jgi:hypothetical protein
VNDLVGTLHAFGRLFDRLGIPYAIMGGVGGPHLRPAAAHLRRGLHHHPRPGSPAGTVRGGRAGPLGVEAKLDEVLAARE